MIILLLIIIIIIIIIIWHMRVLHMVWTVILIIIILHVKMGKVHMILCSNSPCDGWAGGQLVQLIMEYLPLGSLREYILTCKIGLPQCLLFAQQICQVSRSSVCLRGDGIDNL